MVDLYFTCRRYASPLTGEALPCPGSAGEQPAVLLDAFTLIGMQDKSDGE